MATAAPQDTPSPMPECVNSPTITMIQISVGSLQTCCQSLCLSFVGRLVVDLEAHVSFDALFNSEARYMPPKCHPDTRKAALAVVKNWLCREGEGSEKGIMWMSGAPGVGKSAIAQTVCEDLCCDDGSKSWLTTITYRERYGCSLSGNALG